MVRMLEIFRQVNVKPATDKKYHSILTYYSEFTRAEREARDFKRSFDNRNKAFYERVYPVCVSSRDADTLKEILPLIDQLIAILQVAPARGKWPRCL